MDQTYQYIKENNGIDTEESYPYVAKDTPCQFNIKNVATNISVSCFIF